MVAFFARRLLGGFVTLLASTFVLYNLLVYTPGSLHGLKKTRVYGRVVNSSAFLYMAWYYEISKPWPANYLTWMFDPIGNGSLDRKRFLPPNRSSTRSGDLQHKGSGLLIGDFGDSAGVARGEPVLEVMGSHIWLYDLIILSVTFLGIAFVVFQRVGHGPYSWRSSRIPVNARWRTAELWTTG